MRISDWSSDVCSSDLAASTSKGAAAIRGRIDRAKGATEGMEAILETLRRQNANPHPQHGRHRQEARTTQVHCRSEEHTYELQSLMRISYDVFRLKQKNPNNKKYKHIRKKK